MIHYKTKNNALIEVTRIRTLSRSLSIEETEKVRLSVRVLDKNNLSWEDVEDDICSLFNIRCYCAHDCCGCWFGGVDEIYSFGNKYVVETVYSRNY